MDARRLDLYELLKPNLDEEPARALVLALPAEPERLATKDDLASLEERLTPRMDGRLDRFGARMEGRLDGFEARMDARFARMEATLTRRMVTILGAWTILVGSTVGWVSALVG